MKNTTVPVGHQYGDWTVVAHAEPGPHYLRRWLCRCACGTERAVYASNLTSGKSVSCGCRKPETIREQKLTHGQSGDRFGAASTTYSTWTSMLTRCRNPRSKSFDSYGGRGIKVCERWHSFENFLSDMGEKPSKGMSIERVDVNGDYEPGNCVWAGSRQQARNTRRTRLSEEIVSAIRLGALTTEQAVELTGCSPSTVSAARTRRNWKDVRAA